MVCKVLLTLLAALFLSVLPANTEDDKPFLAIYANPGFYKTWIKYNPDLYYESSNFEEFHDFVQMVRTVSQGRPVIVDLDCHGNPDLGLLVLLEKNHSSRASFGYIVNELKALNAKKLTVLTEACYGGYVYQKSLKYSKHSYRKTDLILENGKTPAYPVYGINKYLNWGNFIYAQYHYKIDIEKFDLRKLKPINYDDLDLDEHSPMSSLIIYCSEVLFQKFK